MKKLALLVLTMLAARAMALEIPVSDLSKWTALSFRNIAPNTVTVAGGAMNIGVDASASPLVYRLDAPANVTAVTVRASWSGELAIPAGAVQGDKGADDFVLKLGIVEEGERTLNWLQRRIAADWIQQLFKLAPKGSGVERIKFLSTTQQKSLLGTSRTHPLNDLLFETRITYLDAPGQFEMSYTFPEPVVVLGLWISSDGDDTGSTFDLVIESIELETE